MKIQSDPLFNFLDSTPFDKLELNLNYDTNDNIVFVLKKLSLAHLINDSYGIHHNQVSLYANKNFTVAIFKPGLLPLKIVHRIKCKQK